MDEILIYGPIGYEATARDVVQQLQDLKGKDVLLRIHSEGGSVLDGEAILNAIRQHDGEIFGQIDGMAFSFAAIIALEIGSENLTMPEDGWIMFHEVRTSGGGTADDLERQLDQVRSMNASIVGKLSVALGISEEEAGKRLKEEIWYNGRDALEAGLVSSLTPAQALAAKLDQDQWQNAPKEFFEQNNCPERNQKSRMKFFKVFNKSDKEPSLEIAEVFPSDMGEEIASLQKDLDENRATHIAELVARDEKHKEALQNSLREQAAELAVKHEKELEEKDEAIAAADQSAEEKANATLAQAGHDPVAILPTETQSREERVQAEYAAINIAEQGGAEKRQAFRRNNKEIFGG